MAFTALALRVQVLRMTALLSTTGFFMPLEKSMLQVYVCVDTWLGTSYKCFQGLHLLLTVLSTTIALSLALFAFIGPCRAAPPPHLSDINGLIANPLNDSTSVKVSPVTDDFLCSNGVLFRPRPSIARVYRQAPRPSRSPVNLLQARAVICIFVVPHATNGACCRRVHRVVDTTVLLLHVLAILQPASQLHLRVVFLRVHVGVILCGRRGIPCETQRKLILRPFMQVLLVVCVH